MLSDLYRFSTKPKSNEFGHGIGLIYILYISHDQNVSDGARREIKNLMLCSHFHNLPLYCHSFIPATYMEASCTIEHYLFGAAAEERASHARHAIPIISKALQLTEKANIACN